MPISAIREFLKLEAAGGIILIFAAALAIIFANSPLSGFYTTSLDIPVAIQFGALQISKPLILWINDGLMAVFFFLVGLEIKREILEGELSTPSQFVLPAMAAVGGIVAPALIYFAFNQGNSDHMVGWAIPTATDIAFALGILALVGSRAPLSLKILLTAIAIIDDLGAIAIIAVFYTENLSIPSLILGGIFITGLVVINRLRITRPAAYILLGIALWVCVLKSGVHATLAGVVTAFAIPMRGKSEKDSSMLKDLEHHLHPWVAYVILPLFAFANAGVSFAGIGLSGLLEPVKLGISVGLFAGKQIGVFAMLWLTVKLGLSAMPRDTNWAQLYGVSLLCGVGFTMSLFIGSLAFEHTSFDVPIRLGVLMGSIGSAVCGYLILRFWPLKENEIGDGAR
jgi:NhaA family Na+:H+ antiporter